MKALSIYIGLMFLSFKARVEYRATFLFYLAAILFFYLGQFGLLFVILTRFTEINGWAIGEIAFLYGLLATTQGISAVFFNALNDFEQMVVRGDFDRILIRPLSPLWQIISSKFEVSTLAHFVIGPGALLYGAKTAGLDWTTGKAFFFLLVVVGGTLILGSIRIAVASVAFWTVRNSSLVRIVVYSSKEFIVYPISIYTRGVQLFLTFVFPIAFINYYPAHVFLGKSAENLLNPSLQFLTPVVGVVLFLVARFLWKTGINNYQGTGS
ncbi:MAG: ABC transporter permease [Nitrospinota bacterium]